MDCSGVFFYSFFWRMSIRTGNVHMRQPFGGSSSAVRLQFIGRSVAVHRPFGCSSSAVRTLTLRVLDRLEKIR